MGPAIINHATVKYCLTIDTKCTRTGTVKAVRQTHTWIKSKGGICISSGSTYNNQLTTLEGINGRILDMTLTIRPGDEKGYRKFKMYLAKGGDCWSSVSFRPASGKVRMDRTFSGFGYDIVNNRSFLVDAKSELTVRVIMDRFSVELFFNDGAQAATMILYTPQACDGISFEAEGNVRMDVEKYDLDL